MTGAFNFGNAASGSIQASSIAIGTSEPSQPLQVGTGTTEVFVVNQTGSVGIASTQPMTNLDVNGTARFKSYSERVKQLDIVANAVAIDLSDANSFTCIATSDINEFVLTNIPSESASFTIKIDQDSIGGRTISIDVFKDNTGTPIPIYWPGGVVPVVTPTANVSDIYSFKMFDGDNITGSGMYGVVGGQNFS